MEIPLALSRSEADSDVNVLLPIRSGKVTPNSALKLPRKALFETREDIIEAGERLMNECILFGAQDGRAVDTLGLYHPLEIDAVMLQTSEVYRQRLEDEGRLLPHERVSPLTSGAFYKAFADNSRSAKNGEVLRVFREAVAARMLGALALWEPFATDERDTELSVTIDRFAEFELSRRLRNPPYILAGAHALYARNSELISLVEDGYRHEIDILTISLVDIMHKFGREANNQNLWSDHLAMVIAGLLRGVTARRAFTTPDDSLDPDMVSSTGVKAVMLQLTASL